MRKEYISKLASLFIVLALTFWSLTPLFKPERSVPVFSQSDSANKAFTEIKIDYCYEMPQNGAESAVVIDAESGSILFEKNADMIRGMASTTKIMTALVAIENCLPDTEFKIPKEAVGIEGSSVYLTEGEVLTLRELLYCLLLESGNDAAAAIACCVGGSIENFAEMMNERAAELGLEHTHFTNPHGLSDYEHYTTAKELATITAEAMKYPLFKEICSAKSYKTRRDGKENGRILTNHNKLLFSYEGATGVKTGYTERDGKCLVSSATRNGLTLIAVTLKDNSPTATHKILLDEGFKYFERRKIATSGEISAVIPIINGESNFVTVCNKQDVTVCLPKNALYNIELSLPESIEAPIKEGEIIGEAKITSNGKEVYIIHLETTETINQKEKTFWEKHFGE